MGKAKQERRRSRAGGEGRGEGLRAVRLQELIREEANFLLGSEIRDRRLEGVTITMVELAGDGSCARLWFSVASRPRGNEQNDNEQSSNEQQRNEDNQHHDDRDRLKALEGAAGFMRARLAESLMLKRTPELRFRKDPATRAFDPGAGEVH